MKLYIGGKAQGKLALALEENRDFLEQYAKDQGHGQKPPLQAAELIADGSTCKWQELKEKAVCNHLHLFIRRQLKDGMKEEQLREELERIGCENPGMIILCDEVGCGIVPLLEEEDEYREAVGHILCALAGQADCVTRVICGIGQRIK